MTIHFERHGYSLLKIRDKEIISFVFSTFSEHIMLLRIILCVFVLSEGIDSSECSECS